MSAHLVFSLVVALVAPPESETAPRGGTRPRAETRSANREIREIEPPAAERTARPSLPPPPADAPRAPDTSSTVPVIDQRTPSADLENAWSYSRGSAPRPAYADDSSRSLLQINPIGYYQGVTPSGDNPPPFAAANFGSMPAILTWTGFQRVTGGGSEVFVQLSTPVDYAVDTTAERVTVHLPQTTVNVKNNQRRLDTRFFITPVEYVDVRPTTMGTDIVIALRRAAEPKLAVRSAPGGYHMLVIGFANDTAAAAPVDNPAPPTAVPPAPPTKK